MHREKRPAQRAGHAVALLTDHSAHRNNPQIQPTSDAGRYGHEFSCLQVFSKGAEGFQPRRATASAGDAYEEEADRVAEQVMRRPGAFNGRVSEAHGAWRDEAAPTADRALDPAIRQYMEERFGHDFSGVRVHADAAAAASTESVGALAYTRGDDVVFGAGQYAPHSASGRRLLAHELAHVVQQRSAGWQQGGSTDEGVVGQMQLKRDGSAKGTQPKLITTRDEDTDRVEDAYGGALKEAGWRQLLESAQQSGDPAQFVTLFADVATVAQADRVVDTSGAINVVSGNKSNCSSARRGLNFSPLDSDGWGANASTGFVDEQGKLGIKLSKPGAVQPDVGIVLARSAFRPEKEQTLGVLRHEMIHAEQFVDWATETFLSDPKAKSNPTAAAKAAAPANTELLAYVEGFMTMFHLTQPAPARSDHPAFVELLGALDVGRGDLLPYAEADPAVRSEALGRLQQYYCNQLDQSHRDSFDGFVAEQLSKARADEIISGEPAPDSFAPGSFDDEMLERMSNKTTGDVMGAHLRMKTMANDFFRALQKIIASSCKALATPMKL